MSNQYADVPGANGAEVQFATWAISEGWHVTKRGWPDFICRRGDEVMCVEVKAGPDVLSRWQRETAYDLAAHGVPVFEWHPPSGFDLEGGQLLPLSPVRNLMATEHLALHVAADRAVHAAEVARRCAEDEARHSARRADAAAKRASDARSETAVIAGDLSKLSADVGYLLRHVLDCRTHHVSDRLKGLMRRFGEPQRDYLVFLPDGGIATARPSGVGWPT